MHPGKVAPNAGSTSSTLPLSRFISSVNMPDNASFIGKVGKIGNPGKKPCLNFPRFGVSS